MIRNLLIEGVDGVGKDSLITNLINILPYHQVVHFEKPKSTDYYGELARSTLDSPQRLYQMDSFVQMFRMLSSKKCRFVMNRAHLGEVVYSQRYRDYDGSYVFDLESEFQKSTDVLQTTLLILLYSSNLGIVEDDGDSFDHTKKGEEQDDFCRAFERSSFQYKLKIDVHDGADSFVPRELILNQVLDCLKQISK